MASQRVIIAPMVGAQINGLHRKLSILPDLSHKNMDACFDFIPYAVEFNHDFLIATAGFGRIVTLWRRGLPSDFAW